MASATVISYFQLPKRLLAANRLIRRYSAPAHASSTGPPEPSMFQTVQFPAEANDDLLAVTLLSDVQLDELNRLMNTAEAVEPIDPSFIGVVANELTVSEEQADQLIRVAVVLKRLNLEADVATKVVDDMKEAIRTYTEDEEKRTQALSALSTNQERFVTLASRSEARVRVERRRRIQRGTQPPIEEIRTLVQLRPLFKEDQKGAPVSIECLVPAMTLELKFKRDDRIQSATFGLNRETLDELITSLERAKSKWDLMQSTYQDQICGDAK